MALVCDNLVAQILDKQSTIGLCMQSPDSPNGGGKQCIFTESDCRETAKKTEPP